MRYPQSGNYRDKKNEPRIRTTDEKRQVGNHLEKEHTKVKQEEAYIHQHTFSFSYLN